MTPEYTNQLATQLLLSGLATVLVLGFASCLALVYFRKGRNQGPHGSFVVAKVKSFGPLQQPDYQPSVFEQACRWLVVKNSHPQAVQAALGLHNPTPCSWGEGISRLTSGKLFVSPPVGGWILVVGHGLPEPTEDADRCFHFLCRLSCALGHVQFFSANRVLNHHAWIRAERGRICRAYVWAQETLWNQGDPTTAETELGLKCLAYGEQPNSLEPEGAESQANNAEKVMALAARWSFDPTTLSADMLRQGWGVAGELAQHPSR